MTHSPHTISESTSAFSQKFFAEVRTGQIELAWERFLTELAIEVLSKPEDREEWVAAAEQHLAEFVRSPPPPDVSGTIVPQPPPDALRTPAEAAPKPRKPPPLDRLLKQAAKADKNVKGAEVYPDRTVLQFGEPTPAVPDNAWPLDEFRTKETKQ